MVRETWDASAKAICIRQRDYKGVGPQKANHTKYAKTSGEKGRKQEVAIDFSFLAAHC